MSRGLAALILVAAAACGDGSGEPDGGGGGKPDGGVSPCGIVGATSECTGPTELRRCQGTQAVSESCGAGLVCGSDPATGKGAACHAPEAPCGAIDQSVCSGPILSACLAGKILTIDCRDHFASCVDDGAASCTTPCLEENITPQGRCEGNAIRRCAFEGGSYFVELAACPSGTTCVSSNPDTRLPACMPQAPCTGIGPFGSCDGDTLVRCSGGRRVETGCAAAGAVCAWGGDGLGYVCAPTGESGARVVSGRVLFERRELAGDRLGPIVTRPARSAGVVLVDEQSGATLASGATDDEGRYRLRHDVATGRAAHVLVVAASLAVTRPVRVLRPDGLIHGFASPPFAIGDDTVIDLLVTDRSGASPAFSILDTLVAGSDVLRDTYQLEMPATVTAVFAKGLPIFTQASGTTITVLGEVDDDDGYDDPVLLHELGHVLETTYGRTSNPGAQHRIYTAEDPRLAWSEGFATYFSSMVRNDPRYVDTKIDGSLVIDCDSDRTRANETRPMTQDISENTVSEILWDLGDGGGGDDDEADGAHAPILRVEDMVLRTATSDRGVSGVDLVDFLDGYLLLGTQSLCASTRSVVLGRGFPYDFAGPVRCP